MSDKIPARVSCTGFLHDILCSRLRIDAATVIAVVPSLRGDPVKHLSCPTARHQPYDSTPSSTLEASWRLAQTDVPEASIPVTHPSAEAASDEPSRGDKATSASRIGEPDSLTKRAAATRYATWQVHHMAGNHIAEAI